MAQDWKDAATTFLQVSTTLNPLLWLFKTMLLNNTDLAQQQIDLVTQQIDAAVPEVPPTEKGKLLVESIPSGARVHIDDVYVWAETNTLILVDPGPHKLTLKLSDYLDYVEDFTIAEAEEKTITAVLISTAPPEEKGSVAISSEPTGAKIYKDGEYTWNETDTTLTYDIGTYNFSLKLSGYEDAPKSIAIIKDQTVTWHADLIKIPEPPEEKAVANYTSEPSGARIYWFGVNTGNTTPHKEESLSPISGNAVYKLDGYEDRSVTVSVALGEEKTYHQVLTLIPIPEEITLTINSTPTGAKIYIDDVFKFEYTNTTIKAPAGLHKITLKLSGYKDHNLPYDWPAGTVKTLHVPLQLYEEDDPVVDQPAEEVVIPMEPVEEPTFNSWKVTIRAKDSISGADVAAWILIDDVFKGVTTPAVFYLAPESTYNIKTRLKGYRQGEVTYVTKPLPTA